MIRKKFIFIILPVFAALLLSVMLFSGTMIKMLIQKTLSPVWGAKVEVSDINISVKLLGFSISNIVFADPDSEFNNKFEIETISLSVEPYPLFEKKLVISVASGKGLKLNTERKTSGFLKIKTKQKIAGKNSDASSKETGNSNGRSENMTKWLSGIKSRVSTDIDVSGIINKDDLETMKLIKDTRSDLSKLEEDLATVKELDYGKLITESGSVISELQDINITSPADIEAAASVFNKAENSIGELDSAKKDYLKKATGLKESISEISAKLRRFDKVRDADMKSLRSKMEMPSLEVQDISETVFGPAFTGRFMKYLTYMKKLHRFIPKKSDSAVKVRERSKGRDYIFVKKNQLPALWMKKITVEGDMNKLEINNMASDLQIIGLPLTISFETTDAQIEISSDRSGNVDEDRFLYNSDSYKIADSAGKLTAEAVLKNEQLFSKITWEGKGLLSSDLADYLALSDTEIKIDIKVEGSLESPSFKMSSNIDKLISDSLKKKLSAQYSHAEKALQDKYDKLVNQDKDNLFKESAKIKGMAESELSSKITSFDENKNQLKNYLDMKKMETESYADTRKKEAEAQLKKETEKKLKKEAEKLKGLFKR